MTREEAIQELQNCKGLIQQDGQDYLDERDFPLLDMAIQALREVQKHEETFEWCHDCKEYDKDNYCCHRWSKVIRNTVEELKADTVSREEYNESTEAVQVVRCKDCRHRCKEPIYSKADAQWVIYQIGDCPIICKTVSDDDFCSYGERREPLPQYEEWQDEFNKMCESARPTTFVADEWYRENFGENNGK